MRKDFHSSVIIPAQPGYFLVQTGPGEDRNAITVISRDPIVAWRIETFTANKPYERLYSVTYPVTVDGCIDGDDFGVIRPDGVVHAGDEVFSSVEEWRIAMVSKFGHGSARGA